MVDQYAPLGRTPWGQQANQAVIDATDVLRPGGARGPSALDPIQMGVAKAVDPAYQAASVMADPRTAAQASAHRWGAALHDRNLSQLATDYWNDAGTALTQDLQTLRGSHHVFANAAVKALDAATLGLTANPYFTALAGNTVGDSAHLVTNLAKRWGPALAEVAVAGGSRSLGIKDPFANVKSDYHRDPAGTLAEDLSGIALIAGGAAGVVGRLPRAGPELRPEPIPGRTPAHPSIDPSGSSVAAGPLTRQLGDRTPAIAENIQNKYGMPIKDQKLFQEAVDEHDVIADVRPSNTSSLPDRINNTGLPKDQKIKVKTINRYDEMLNPELRGQAGRAGYFDPGKPPERGNLSEPDWANLNARHTERAKEYTEYRGKMTQLDTKNEIKVNDGVVYGKASDGA